MASVPKIYISSLLSPADDSLASSSGFQPPRGSIDFSSGFRSLSSSSAEGSASARPDDQSDDESSASDSSVNASSSAAAGADSARPEAARKDAPPVMELWERVADTSRVLLQISSEIIGQPGSAKIQQAMPEALEQVLIQVRALSQNVTLIGEHMRFISNAARVRVIMTCAMLILCL